MTSLDTKRGTLGGRWSKNQPHKDSVDYWRKRVTKRRSGTGREIGHYSVRFRQSGREAWFSLSTANVAIAANQAREIHRHIQANGLLSAIERYKVKDDFRERPPTIGEWIESVKKYRSREDCRETTFADYVRKTRTLFATVLGIDGGASKHDHRTGGTQQWREKLNAVPMDRITEQKIIDWRNNKRDQAAKNGPSAERSAMRTVNSLLRSAKSMFSAKHNRGNPLAELVGNPLINVSLFRDKPPAFEHSKAVDDPVKDIGYFISSAKRELNVSGKDAQSFEKREIFKTFLLAILSGLRRSEIDKLLWSSISQDETGPYVAVEITDFGQAKNSSATYQKVRIDPEFHRLLMGLKKNSSGIFVLEGKQYVDHERTDSHRYRVDKTHEKLIKWLKAKGVIARNPIHTLRKMIGSHINRKHGLDRASSFLRHSDMRITQAYYVSPVRVSAGLGSMLDSDGK